MGKSLKNAVAPDDICHNYGTDTLRAYEMYMGPLEASKPWSPRDIVGMSRFLQAVWRRFVAEDGSIKGVEEVPDDRLHRLLHKTVKRVTFDMHNLRFNTAIAALIELNNALSGAAGAASSRRDLRQASCPLAPHCVRSSGSGYAARIGIGRSVSSDGPPTTRPCASTPRSRSLSRSWARSRPASPARLGGRGADAGGRPGRRTHCRRADGKTVRKVGLHPGGGWSTLWRTERTCEG